ncbi:cell division protein FtsA [Candidatus Fermentibacteria bacterium]|nr:MAG: cell division protein FtsA [Candidatus Fermentibacteria bacterium]
MSRQRVLAGIDIGCSGVKCAIALDTPGEMPEIAGVGIAPCSGHIRQGVLINAGVASEAVRRAVEEAEQTSGLEIESAWAGITGLHVRGMLSSHTNQISENRNGEPEKITWDMIRKVVKAAENINLPSGCRILERKVRDYSFDGFTEIPEPPLGLIAASVQARVFTIYADRISTDNLVSVIADAGVDVEGVIPSSVASAEAVLNDDEKMVGTVVVDIGASNTDMVIFHRGSPVYISSFAMGGNRITSDIQSLGISWAEADKIKKESVTAIKMFAESKELSVRKVGGRRSVSISLPVLVQIASSRVEEMFSYVSEEIVASGLSPESLTGGIVVTGGGARMNGILKAASEITGHQVEPGVPRGITSDSKLVCIPEMATAVGLVVHGAGSSGTGFSTGRKTETGRMIRKFREFINKLK